MADALNDIQIGGVNLITGSQEHTMAAEESDVYWMAADELKRATMYTLSVEEVVLNSGTAAGVTWKVVDLSDVYKRQCSALRIRSTFAPTMLREPSGTLRGFDTVNTSIYKVYEASDLI